MNATNLNTVDRPDVASRLFDLFDREQIKMPIDYLPDAPGVAIAGDALLHALAYSPGSKRPPDWFKTKLGVFRYLKRFEIKPGLFGYTAHADGVILQVRQCGKLWVIERYRDGDWLDPSGRCPGLNLYALVCAQTERPIWTTTYQAAMRLAHHCHPAPKSPVIGHWLQVHAQEHAECAARSERERAARERVC
jgi:hypothetical protein